MIPHLFYYQLVVLGLLWLCVMLHAVWPSRGTESQPRPAEAAPLKPKRTRFHESQPFAGLTHQPHWLEEAQHIKSDMLEVAQLARALSPEELSAAFDQVVEIGGLVDATFVGQVDQEIATLQQVIGRTLSAVEATTLRDTLYQSLRAIIAGVALTDPSFAKVALELSKESAAKLGIA